MRVSQQSLVSTNNGTKDSQIQNTAKKLAGNLDSAEKEYYKAASSGDQAQAAVALEKFRSASKKFEAFSQMTQAAFQIAMRAIRRLSVN